MTLHDAPRPVSIGGVVSVAAHDAVADTKEFQMARRKPTTKSKSQKPHRTTNRLAKKRVLPNASLTPAAKAQVSSASSKPPAAALSKQETVLAMLRQPKGTTIAAIMQATEWQQHTVRGFFAGTVRKKLKLNLTSGKTDGQRLYRIAKTVPSK